MRPSRPPGYQSDDDPKDTARAMAAVKAMLDTHAYICKRQSQTNLFDTKVMGDLSRGLIHASAHPKHPSVLYEIVIDESYTNLNGVLHGGAACLIFDMATMSALAPIQREDYWDFQAGLSRTLNLSYLKGLTRGTKVHVRCWVMQHGRSMSMLSGTIESVDGETVYATCEHHKFHVPSFKEHVALREEMKKELKQKEEEERQKQKDSKDQDDKALKSKL